MLTHAEASEIATDVLRDPLAREWSLQGFGMLRTYLNSHDRLHVWDSRYRAPAVSTIHDHPWDFKSVVVSGVLANHRYVLADASEGEGTHLSSSIKCGPGGGLVGEPRHVTLVRLGLPQVFRAGSVYRQRAAEIHETNATDGTVTIVRRSFLSDSDHAVVAWPIGREWGSAEPRPATREEVLDIVASARRWGY